jgi:hypothetical protein
MSLAAYRAVVDFGRLARSSRPRIQFSVLPLLVLLATAPACASSSKGTGYDRAGKEMQITPSQLQVKVRALADPFSGIIEDAVWELWDTDPDPRWRQNLLVWQINVVNAVQRATLQAAPLAAFFDTWALVEQLRAFAEDRRGSNNTSEQVQIVLDAVERMDAMIMRIAIEAGGEEGAASAGRLIREWALDHPIDKFATRTSTESELAQWTARGNMGTMATVKSLGASLDDVMERLDLFAEYIPKQASWHAQAIALEYLGNRETEGAFADLSKTATAFDRIATSLEGYPEVASDERRAVMATVQQERAIVLEELLDKLSELQLFVNDQRSDLMETQVTAQREAVLDAIAAERAIIIDTAIKERAETMVQLKEMVDDVVENTAFKLVDHFFLRAVQLVAILLAGLGLIAVLIAMLWKRG